MDSWRGEPMSGCRVVFGTLGGSHDGLSSVPPHPGTVPGKGHLAL